MWLLFEITREFGLVATVRDYDGEFLLIEAAAALPAWMEPETTENRVLISNGRLHIVRPPLSPREVGKYPTGKLSLAQALDCVRNDSLDTLAPADVEAAVLARISGYPNRMKENTHRSLCYVPRKVAELLAREPGLVTPAVEAFYSRDPISSRPTSKMERFDPSTCVPVTVRFTRLAYAQLVSQQFYPPKPFLPFIPPPTDPSYLAWQAGVKLACGFEILAAEPRWRRLAEQFPDWTLESHDFESDTRWKEYRAKLEARGYFELDYEKELLESVARRQYLLHHLPPSKPAADPIEVIRNPVALISHLIALPALPDDQLNREPPDSVDWMTVGEDELNQMMDERGVRLSAEDLQATDADDILAPRQKGDDSDESSGEEEEGDDEEDSKELDKLRRLISGMSEFLDRESGVKGAVFPGEQDGEDEEDMEADLERRFGELMESDDEDEGEPDVQGGDAKRRKVEPVVEAKAPRLDPRKFAQAMGRTLGEERVADSDDESSLSDGDEDAAMEPPSLEAYMEAMDAELAETKLAGDFERMEPAKGGEGESEGLPPVNLDLNLVKNLLASFHAQEGLPGPATGLLAGLGVGNFKLPKEEEG